jgi:hypothetical protein
VTSPTNPLWGALRGAWTSLTGVRTNAAQPVVIHDPAAEGAQDLDDPFIDPNAQSRVADLIAKAGRKSD